MRLYSSSCSRHIATVGAAVFAATILFGLMPMRVAAGSPQVDPLAGNSRLEQVVQVRTEGIAVGDLLNRITKATGVYTTANSDVADDKVILFGPPRPLKDLLADLAALYNDSWAHTRTAEGKDHYTLSRSRTAHEYEEKLASDVQDRMMKQLDAYIAASKSGVAYPYEVYRIAAQFLGLLSLEQQQQLLQRKSLNLPYHSLTPAEQRIAQQGVETLYQADADSAKKSNLEYHRPPDSNLEEGGLRFQIQNAGVDASGNHLHLFLIVGAAYSEDFGTLDDRIPWLLPIRGNPYSRKPMPDSVRVPDLSHLAEQPNLQPQSWSKCLEALAATTGAPVMADYYRCQPPALPTVDPFPVEKGDPGRIALDQWGRVQSALWWVRGSTLLVRRRNWYTQRLSETPDRWVLDLHIHLNAQKGIPTYGDVLALTQLTQAQMAGLRVPESLSRSSGILGDGTDETSLAGLPELLAIYKSRFAIDFDRRIPRVPLNPDDLRRATITYQDLPVQDRGLVNVFLQAQPNPVSQAASGEGFATILTRTGPNASESNSVHLSLGWGMGSFALKLPVRLEDDHRDLTEVRVVKTVR